MKKYKCKICGEVFDDYHKLGGHSLSHKKSYPTIRKEERIIKYNKLPNYCGYCEEPLNYEKRKNKFCSRSCSASFNNSGVTRNGNPSEVISCLNCGNEAKSLVSQNRKFCSTECSGEYTKKNSIVNFLNEEIQWKTPVGTIKEYILKDQDSICSICKNPPIWNGKPIVFICDHISGDSTDNRRGNLRMICPNCDSQLDTYKSKNKGNGRFSRRERYKEGKSY